MQGRHAVPMGMIGVEESSKSRPIRAGVGECGPKRGEIYRIFAKFRDINASHLRILCASCTKFFSEIVRIFLLGQMFKFGEIQSGGSRAKETLIWHASVHKGSVSVWQMGP